MNQQAIDRAVLQQMRQNSIPFNTTDPPTLDPPPYLPPTTKPRVHHLVAWRHDGEVRKTAYQTKELAIEAGRALHWVIVWKYAVMDGREMVLRQAVEEPRQ